MNYRQGDIFLANLNPSKGYEPGKERLVIIVQGNSLNEVGYPTCLIVPCSSQKMPITNLRPVVDCDCFERKTYALLDQVRAIDVKKRLKKKIGRLSEGDLSSVLGSLKLIIS